MTYQRNIQLEDRFYEWFPNSVHEPQEGARDDDEAEDDCGALRDVTAVRPLHAAELVDDVAQEGDDPTPRPPRVRTLDTVLGDRRVKLVGSGLDGLVEVDRLVRLDRLDVAAL